MSEIAVPDASRLSLNSLRLLSPSQVNRSAWTGVRKVIGLPGAEMWRGEASIDIIATEDEEAQWRAFLFGLRGPINFFRWTLPCNTHAGDKPTVAAGATAYSLPLTGMQPNTIILRAGKFITVPLPSGNVRAVVLSADLVANGSGAGTAVFNPALTLVPTTGVSVETKDPFILMALADPEQGFSMANGISGSSFQVEEAR